MTVRAWNEPGPPKAYWPEAVDSSRALTARNTKQPMDLFDPRGNTVTRDEYYGRFLVNEEGRSFA